MIRIQFYLREDYILIHHFVDKSLLIKELIDDASKVTLITRPRRFGKSLNFSMQQKKSLGL